MMKKIILLLLGCFINGQTSFLPIIPPPTPTVASLLKYAEVPVNNYNGTVSFNIPLYQIKEGNLEIPISVSYYSTGLKVEEEASNIGLGWSLNAGGVIHIINDPYLKNYLGLVPTIYEASQNQYEDHRESNFIFNSIINGCNFETDEGRLNMPVFDVQRSGAYTTYAYSFNGYNGKFLEDNNHDFISLDKNNIRFERLNSGFKAITPEGNIYYFEFLAVNNTYSTNLDCVSANYSSSYSYYLSKIESVNKQTANFVYSKVNITGMPHFMQTLSTQKVSGESNPFNATWQSTGLTLNPDEEIKSGYSVTNHNDLILSEISTNNCKILFENSNREDISGGKKIDKIIVYDKFGNNKIKTILFNYDYFVGESRFGDFTDPSQRTVGCGIYPASVSLDYKSKRLKLNSISFSESNNSQTPNYNFGYNKMSLPYKTSLAQDLWGYFNGVDNNRFLLPDVNNLGFKDDNVPFFFISRSKGLANRKADENYLKAGLLTTIINPTGAHTQINYEINNFSNSSITKNLKEVEKIVTDYNSTTEQSVSFTIPNITNQQVKLSMFLNCNSNGKCNSDIPTGSGECPPYSNSGLPTYQTTHPNDFRLYGLLEKKTNGIWQKVEEYSRISTDLVNEGEIRGVCGLYDKDLTHIILPGEYRMTVNYPDNKSGFLGGPWVQMKLKYYEESEIIYPNTGAGLRIKNIVDYDINGKGYNERNYSYSNGILMTKPIFYRIKDAEDTSKFAKGDYLGCVPIVSNADNCIINNVNNPPRVANIVTYSLNSDAVLPYSLNAQGSLVGYSEVDINYVQKSNTNDNLSKGGEIFKYNNIQDYSFYYPSKPVGLPEIRFLRNGTLKEKITYKNIDTGKSNLIKEIIKLEKFDFIVNNQKRYWQYIAEYLPKTYYCVNNQSFNSSIRNLAYNYLHFYPIKTGKVLLKSKEEINYFKNGNVSQKFIYDYNNKNQLISEKIFNSNGDEIINKTYYPNDLLTSIQATQMIELININQIDIPIKAEKYVNNIKVSNTETIFGKDESTNNVLMPKEIHSLSGNAKTNFNFNDFKKVSFDKYDDKGNILQYTSNSGFPTVFIWGYNQSLLIAKIEGGATYPDVNNPKATDIPQSLIDTLVLASNSDINFSSEQNLIQAFDDFRMNNKMINYQITTYSHNPLIGMTTITLPNGIRENYYYNSYNNYLAKLTDVNGNILKEYKYGYKSKADLNSNIFFNTAISKNFIKNNCPSGYVGTPYIYTIPEGKYISFNSQYSCDQQAQNDINQNGQIIANLNGECLEGCPLVLNPSIPASLFNNYSKKENNSVTLNFEISPYNLNINWNQIIDLGFIGNQCAPLVNNKSFAYSEPNSNRIWTVLVYTTGNIKLILNTGSVISSSQDPLVFSLKFDR